MLLKLLRLDEIQVAEIELKSRFVDEVELKFRIVNEVRELATKSSRFIEAYGTTTKSSSFR